MPTGVIPRQSCSPWPLATDSRRDVRQRAAALILQSRRQAGAGCDHEVRPSVSQSSTSQPQTRRVSSAGRKKTSRSRLSPEGCDAEVESIIEVPFEVPHCPVHSQAVERAVQVVTAASSAVTTENQHGFICARLKHRSSIRQVNTQRDF